MSQIGAGMAPVHVDPGLIAAYAQLVHCHRERAAGHRERAVSS